MAVRRVGAVFAAVAPAPDGAQMESENKQKLRELEAQARQLENRGEYADALDRYDDIDAKGWIGAGHLTAMARCYLKNRQRRDAKQCLLRALDLDPACAASMELMDRHFPGWEKAAPGKAPPPDVAPHPLPLDEAPPPPPMPPAAGPLSLTVETIQSQPPEETKREKVVRPDPAPAERPKEPSLRDTYSLRPPQTAGGAGASAAGKPRPPRREPAPKSANSDAAEAMPAVNWAYVTADALEEAGGDG